VSILRTSGVIPVDSRSSIEFTIVQPDPIHHRISHTGTGRSQYSSSATKKTHSRTSCQATSASDAHDTASVGTLSAHDNASRDLNAPRNLCSSQVAYPSQRRLRLESLQAPRDSRAASMV
jgi:hypothetical protein